MKKIGVYGNPVRLPEGASDNTGNIVHANAALSMFSHASSLKMDASEAGLSELRDQFSHLAFAAATVLQVNRIAPFGDKLAEAADFVEKLGLPVVTLGFGHSSNSSIAVRDAEVDPRSVRLLQVLAAHAETVAVRGELTADLCRKVGVNNVEVIGCQSVYYAASQNKPGTWVHRERTGRSMASTTSGMENTDLTQFLIKHDVDLIGQNETAEYDIARGKLPIEAFTGKTGDYKLPNAIAKGLNPAAVSLKDYHDYISTHFYKFFDMDSWTAHIAKEYDFAFGTRFHGNVAALLSGVPALWLTHDTRTVELCRHFRLPSIKAQDLWAYRSMAELKEVTDYEPFSRRIPLLIDDFLAYLDKNVGQERLTPEFIGGLKLWQ